MSNEELCRKVYELSFTAGMNQRYHQLLGDQYGDWDWYLRLGVSVLTVISLILTGLTAKNDNKPLLVAAFVFAVIAALVGAYVSIAPYHDRQLQHTQLFQRWSDLRQDCDAMLIRCESQRDATTSEQHFLTRLEELTARKNQINADEPSPDRDLLNDCFDDESRARNRAQNDRKQKEPPKSGLGF